MTNKNMISQYMKIKKMSIDSSNKLFLILMPLTFSLSNTIGDAVTTLIGILFLIKNIKDKNYQPYKTPIFLILLTFTLCGIITSAFADYKPLTASFTMLTWIRFPFALVAIAYYFSDRNFTKKWIVFNTYFIIALSVDLLIQNYTGFDILGKKVFGNFPNDFRLTGPLGSPHIAALMFISSGGLFFFHARNIIKDKFANFNAYISILFVILISFSIIISYQRVAFLFLSFTTLMFALVYIRNLKEFFISSSLIVVLTGSTFLFSPETYDRNVVTIVNGAKAIIGVTVESEKQESTLHYRRIWSSAYNLGKENLLTGVGRRNFRDVCPQYALKNNLNEEENCGTHPHNFTLEVFAELGVINLVIFFGVFVLALLTLIRNYKILIERSFNLQCVLLTMFLFSPFAVYHSFFGKASGASIALILGIAFSSLITSKKDQELD